MIPENTTNAFLCEGLDARQVELMITVRALLTWVRAFYSESLHRFGSASDDTALMVVGAIATCYCNCFRRVAEICVQPTREVAQVCMWIDKCRDYMKSKGSHNGDVLRFSRNQYGDVISTPRTAMEFNADIMKVHEEYLRQLANANKKG